MRGILRQAGARLVGPGGYYNAGLAAGIAVAISALPEGGMGVGGVLGATLAHLGGDPTALALTGATAIFFWSGECYHRAWANGFPPIETLNRRSDFLSGIGALVLGVALLSLGQPCSRRPPACCTPLASSAAPATGGRCPAGRATGRTSTARSSS